jgi:hypothetical protein
MKRIILPFLVLCLSAAVAYPCDNSCWRTLNKTQIERVIKNYRFIKKKARKRLHIETQEKLRQLIDSQCEQGFALTPNEIAVQKRFGFKNCSEPPTPTPTPTPNATPTPTARPTPTPTPRPTPSATPTPPVTPTPTPTVTPTPTPGGCVMDRVCWLHTDWCTTELQLGNHVYNEAQLRSILQEPTAFQNGLVALAHELISARLGIACDSNPACIRDTLAQADFLIGNLIIPPVGNGFLPPASVSNIVQILHSYNAGQLCAPLCEEEPR